MLTRFNKAMKSSGLRIDLSMSVARLTVRKMCVTILKNLIKALDCYTQTIASSRVQTPPEFFNSPLLANSPLNFENIPSPPPLFDHLPPELNKSDLRPTKFMHVFND